MMLKGIDGRRMVVRAGMLGLLPAWLIVAACGGDGGSGKKVDVEDWVADVCDLAVESDEDITEIFAELDDVDLADRGARDDIVKAFEDARKALDEREDKFNGIGQPDIDGGSEVRNVFRDAIAEDKRNADRLIKEIKKLDEGRNFEDDFNDLLEEIDIDDPDLREDLEDINERDVDDLIDLIDEDPECSSLLFDN